MTTRIRHSEVAIGHGWRARVATAAEGIPFAFPDSRAWIPLLNALTSNHLPSDQVDWLKESAGGSVCRVRAMLPKGIKTVICRRWPPKSPWLERIHRICRTGNARLYWRKAIRLVDAGINTALPFALCESLDGTWLVTTEVEHALDLDTIVLAKLPRLDQGEVVAAKRRLSIPIADLLARLYRCRIYHRDLKASNLLFTDWQSSPRIWIVDVEGVRALSWKRGVFPLVRLGSSLLAYRVVTRTDYARVLKTYLKLIDPTASKWRSRFVSLGDHASKHSVASHRRKQAKLDQLG